jgi:hypothetical protein
MRTNNRLTPHFLRRTRCTPPHFETLEVRRMLAGDNLIAQFDGEITTVGETRQIAVTLDPTDFMLRGN